MGNDTSHCGSESISLGALVDKLNRSIAITHYQRFGDRTLLKRAGVSSRTLKRPGGRSCAYKMTWSENGNVFRGAIWKDSHVAELVFRQKWMAGVTARRDHKGEKQTFVAVAKILGCSPTQIKSKWARVPLDVREQIELNLLTLLVEPQNRHFIHSSMRKLARHTLNRMNKNARFPPPAG